jgi:hypothetical protein
MKLPRLVCVLVASLAPFCSSNAEWHCYESTLNVTIDGNSRGAVLREFRSAATRANMLCSWFEPFSTVVQCNVNDQLVRDQRFEGRFLTATYYGPHDSQAARVEIDAYLGVGTPSARKARDVVLAMFAELKTNLKGIAGVVAIHEWDRDPKALKSDCLGEGKSS